MKGIPVTLFEKKAVGKDKLNKTIYKEYPEVVENVLVAPGASSDIVTSTDLEGKKAVFTLGIPKGDTHIWEDKNVEFVLAGTLYKCRSFGFTMAGIESNVPTRWHRKIMVEQYG